MTFHVMTLFPQQIEDILNHSVTGRALKNGIIELDTVDIRDYSLEKHRHVDDYPYGGGPGMLMMAQPVCDCYDDVMKKIREHRDCQSCILPVLYMTPAGETFNQQIAKELSEYEDVIIICGHYEGIDERALEITGARGISLGDFVLTGGELPAATIIDCVSRLIPGVLGKDESANDESFSDGLLEYPQYTRPEEYRGLCVPEILLSGHHENVAKWRRQESIKRTYIHRPDILDETKLSKKELLFLNELKNNQNPVIPAKL